MSATFNYQSVGPHVTAEVESTFAAGVKGEVKFFIRLTAPHGGEAVRLEIGNLEAAKEAVIRIQDAIHRYDGHHKIVSQPVETAPARH